MGTVFISEGQVTHTDLMMLILDVEMLLQNEVACAGDSTVMSVVGSASMTGEMDVLDAELRTATSAGCCSQDAAKLTSKTD